MRIPGGPERRGLGAELEAYGQRHPQRRAVVEQLLALLERPGDAFRARTWLPGTSPRARSWSVPSAGACC